MNRSTNQATLNRRQFLWQSGGGLGGIALASLLGESGFLAAPPAKAAENLNGGLHHPARAKRVVQLFMSGAASQCDTFDYKPKLVQQHGQKWDPGEQVELFQSSPGACLQSPWDWKQYGQCGKWMSSLVPCLAECVDQMCFIPSMVSKSNVHGPATFMQSSGFVLPGFPRRNWDSHENIERDHGDMGRGMDRPAAALIKDLQQRGLLDETIILWTTEFGRMPCSQGSLGRDHNPFTFTNWLAGGGVKGGCTYGASDEWSYKAAEHPTYCYDIHATLLHLLGIDHTRLTYRHNGIDRRLTDVHGHVIREIIS